MQLKKLMIEVMVFFVLGCFFCACGKTKDQTRKTTKDANKETIIRHLTIPMRMAIWQESM